MAFPVVTIAVKVVDKTTYAELIPVFTYKVELTGFSASSAEHPEVVRVTQEEKAKVMFASRWVNKYMKEHPTILQGQDWKLLLEVLSIT